MSEITLIKTAKKKKSTVHTGYILYSGYIVLSGENGDSNLN